MQYLKNRIECSDKIRYTILICSSLISERKKPVKYVKGEQGMAVSYNNLWKLLIDKGLNKGDLRQLTGMSSSTMAKMTNNEPVTISVLEKICEQLDCDFSDLISYKKDSAE